MDGIAVGFQSEAGTGLLAGTAGCMIGWVDSRPAWDDTGITAVSLLVVSAVLGFYRPRHWWVVFLALSIPVVAFDYFARPSPGAWPALLFTGIPAVLARLTAPRQRR